MFASGRFSSMMLPGGGNASAAPPPQSDNTTQTQTVQTTTQSKGSSINLAERLCWVPLPTSTTTHKDDAVPLLWPAIIYQSHSEFLSCRSANHLSGLEKQQLSAQLLHFSLNAMGQTGRVCQLLCRSNTINSILVVADETYFEFVDVVGAQLQHYACQPNQFSHREEYLAFHQALDESMQLLGYTSSSTQSQDSWIRKAQAALSTATSNGTAQVQVQVQAPPHHKEQPAAKSPARPPAPALAQQHPAAVAGAPSPNDQPSIAAVSLGSTIATNESSLPHHHSTATGSRMPPPPPSLQLDKYASWTDTWSELLFQGWQMYQSTASGGSGNLVYSAPNGLSFDSLEQVQTYVTNAYGWVGPHRKKRWNQKPVYTPTTQSFYHFGVLWKQTLEPLGWTMVKAPPSYHCDWLYLTPQVTVGNLASHQQGVHYFTQDFQVVQYCQQQQYHLKYNHTKSKKSSPAPDMEDQEEEPPFTPVETPLQDHDHDDNATTMTTPQGQATVPQDPAQPQLMEDDSDDESDSEEPPLSMDEYYNFNNHLWPLLQSRGYTWDHGSGLIDRYYFRPGCSKKYLQQYTEGVEYWISQHDLMETEMKKDELAQVGPFAKKKRSKKSKANASSKPKSKNQSHKRRSTAATSKATATTTPAPAPKRRTKKPTAKVMLDDAPEEDAVMATEEETTTTPVAAASKADDDDTVTAPDSESSLVSKDTYYAWKNVKLRHFFSGGWFYMKSPNPLQDYWYVRPGRDKSQRQHWEQGIDYFTSQDDVVEFLKQQDEQQAEQANTKLPYKTKKTSQNKRKQSNGPTQARKAARRSKQAQKKRTKEQDKDDDDASMEVVEQKQEPIQSTTKPASKPPTTKATTAPPKANAAAVDAPLLVEDPNDNDAPWVTLEIPNSGWPFLKQLGCTYGPGSKYKFVDPTTDSILWQGDMIELPHFLATQGVPNAHLLSQEELAQLTVWVNFDPLPISIYTGGKKNKIVYSHMVRELQEHEVELYLRRLGFTKTTTGTGWKAPEQAATSLHVTEFHDLEHVRQVLRSVRDLEAACRGTTTQGRRRSSHKFPPLLQPLEMLALRLWIAMTPAPLPLYGNTSSGACSGAASAQAPASSKKVGKQQSSSSPTTAAQTASVAVETPLVSMQNNNKKKSTSTSSSSKAKKASASARKSSKSKLSKKTTTTPRKQTEALSASSPSDCSDRSESNRSMASIMSQADVSREELLQLEARQSHWQWAWKLLQKLGCYWASGDYRLPRGFGSVKSNAGFASVDDLVRYCCQYGIPNLNATSTTLTPKEASDLMEYVQFINVDFGLALTQGVKIDLLLDDESAWYILTLLGFELLQDENENEESDSKYVLPGVKELGLSPDAWIHGVHYVQGPNELVNLVRSTKDLTALPNAFVMGRSSRRKKSSSSNDTSCRAKNHQLLALRIWAAKHDEPLPVHPTLQELQNHNATATTDDKDKDSDDEDEHNGDHSHESGDEHDNEAPEEDEQGSHNDAANDEPEKVSSPAKEEDDGDVASNSAMEQDSDDEAPEKEAKSDDDSSKGQVATSHSSSPSTSGLIGFIKEQKSSSSSNRSVGSTSVRTRRSTSSHESFHTPAQTMMEASPVAEQQPHDDSDNGMSDEEEEEQVQVESPLNDEVVRLLTQDDTMQILTQAVDDDEEDDGDDSYLAQPKNLSFDTPGDENHLQEEQEYKYKYNQDVDRFVPMTQPEEPELDNDDDDESSDASSMASMMHNLPSRATPSASSIRTATTRSQTKTPASRTRSHHAPPSSALSL